MEIKIKPKNKTKKLQNTLTFESNKTKTKN
jgi:hypothetical protein